MGWWRFPGRKGQGAYPVCLVLNVKVGEDFDIRDWVWSCGEAALTGRTAAAWQVGSRGWQAFRWCHSWCKMPRRYQDRWYMEHPMRSVVRYYVVWTGDADPISWVARLFLIYIAVVVYVVLTSISSTHGLPALWDGRTVRRSSYL